MLTTTGCSLAAARQRSEQGNHLSDRGQSEVIERGQQRKQEESDKQQFQHAQAREHQRPRKGVHAGIIIARNAEIKVADLSLGDTLVERPITPREVPCAQESNSASHP